MSLSYSDNTNPGSVNENNHLQPSGTTGTNNDPGVQNYAQYREVVGGLRDGLGDTAGTTKSAKAYTTTDRSDAWSPQSLQNHVYDPWGPGSRERTYGPNYGWVNPWDTDTYSGDSFRGGPKGDLFKYNQMLMTVAENFDPFIQRQEAEDPHWWLNRVPRRAYQLFNGLVHQANVYRGGLSVYSGLGDWEDLSNDPTKQDACGPISWKTYSYAWETRAWSGKRTAWGSDPFCLDTFKFVPQAMEQLGWIIETGAKFGTAIQNIWNRDMFIYHSVMSQRSYVMSKEYRGTNSARCIYGPFCKLNAEDGAGAALVAEKNAVDGKPFVVIDATFGGPEPINFEALQLLRRELNRVCPDGAVGTIGNSKMYAICISADDLDNYIRGNEEERKNYLEADPAALTKGWDIAPTTFRRWLITEDGDQLRFKFKAIHPEYTEAVAKQYGYADYKELAGRKVMIGIAVDPMRAGKPGINGSPIPEANPEYDLAELAIAPVFINHVFTNEFVPSCPGLGHGTYFGTVGGLNGSWKWYNIQTEKNPDQKVGNFRGLYEIVPRPEARAAYATSFIYRRCAQPLESLCPVQNQKLNPRADEVATTIALGKVTGSQADLILNEAMSYKAGDSVKITLPKETVFMDGEKKTGLTFQFGEGTCSVTVGSDTYTASNGSWTSSTTVNELTTPTEFTSGSDGNAKKAVFYCSGATDTVYDAMVFSAMTQQQKSVQFTDAASKPVDGLSLAGFAITK